MADITVTVAAPGSAEAGQAMANLAAKTGMAAGAAERFKSANLAMTQAISKAATAEVNYAKFNERTTAALKKRAEWEAKVTKEVVRRNAEAKKNLVMGSRDMEMAGISRTEKKAGPSKLQVAGELFGVSTISSKIGTSLAIVAGVTGLMEHYVTRNAELLQHEAEGRIKYIDMQNQARDMLGKTALAAARDQGDSIKKLLAIGGINAVSRANQLSKQGFTGAAEGLAYAETKGRGMDHTSVEAAKRAAATGLISFGDAMHDVVDKGLNNARDILQYRFMRTFSEAEISSMVSRRGETKLGASLKAIDEVDGISKVRQQDIIIRRGEAEARGQMAALLDPLSKMLIDAYNESANRTMEMQRVADMQSPMFKLWQDLTSHKGSIQVQVLRGMRDDAASLPSN